MSTGIQTHAQTHQYNAMKPQPKWQDWIILLVAGILFISPWVFGTATQTFGAWNAWIVSIGFVPLTLRTTFFLPPGGYANKCTHEGGRTAWWQRILDTCKLSHIAKEEIVVGAWLFVAPWILGFAAMGAASAHCWHRDCGPRRVEAAGIARPVRQTTCIQRLQQSAIDQCVSLFVGPS